MTRLTDTHTHLYLPEFETDGCNSAVDRAIAAGVDRLIFPNVDLTTIEPMMTLASAYPDNIAMAMGLHPTEISENWQADLQEIISFLDKFPNKFAAIGEIGIDLYWDKSFREQQLEALAIQFNEANKRSLPVIIHCRDGLDEVLSVMNNAAVPNGVFHSFGGTVNDVERIRRHGDFYFGINGIVTFKNSKLKDVLYAIGIERILLETDSPYLAPVPHRGKRNESAFITHVAAYIAQILGMSFEDVAAMTNENAKKLFGI